MKKRTEVIKHRKEYSVVEHDETDFRLNICKEAT